MYKKLQAWGIVFVLSLILAIILIDRLIIMDLPFSFNLKNWYWLSYVMVFFLFLSFVSWRFVKSEEKKENVVTHRWNEKIMQMLTNTAKGSPLDIITLLIFLAFAAWIPDAILDFIKGEFWFRPFLYIVGLFLLVIGKPSFVIFREKVKADDRSLMLTGMSNVSNKFQMNLEPVIKPLTVYSNIKTFLVLLSDEILNGYNDIYLEKEENDNLKKALIEYVTSLKNAGICAKKLEPKNLSFVHEIIRKLLKAYINEIPAYRGKEIEIKFSNPVDYNNFDACNDECYRFLQDEMKKKYKDEHVVVNTTPGTKMVTSAMAINSIKGNRAMVYISQSGGEVIEANPNVSLTQFGDLFEEREMGGTN